MAICPFRHRLTSESIITPTYNRQKLIDIAFHNLLVTDYPKDKIEWVVIEDNEKTPHMAAEKIISFQIQVPDIKIKYMIDAIKR